MYKVLLFKFRRHFFSRGLLTMAQVILLCCIVSVVSISIVSSVSLSLVL